MWLMEEACMDAEVRYRVNERGTVFGVQFSGHRRVRCSAGPKEWAMTTQRGQRDGIVVPALLYGTET